MLKYGLWVINGTAGGRSCAYAEQDTKSVTAVIVIDIGNGLIREVRITLFSCRESSLISLVVTRFRDFVSTWTAKAVIGGHLVSSSKRIPRKLLHQKAFSGI
jgi:hypothetical protein